MSVWPASAVMFMLANRSTSRERCQGITRFFAFASEDDRDERDVNTGRRSGVTLIGGPWKVPACVVAFIIVLTNKKTFWTREARLFAPTKFQTSKITMISIIFMETSVGCCG